MKTYRCWPRVRSHQNLWMHLCCVALVAALPREWKNQAVLQDARSHVKVLAALLCCWLPSCILCQEGSRCPGELPDYSQLLKTQHSRFWVTAILIFTVRLKSPLLNHLTFLWLAGWSERKPGSMCRLSTLVYSVITILSHQLLIDYYY